MKRTRLYKDFLYLLQDLIFHNSNASISLEKQRICKKFIKDIEATEATN